MKSGKSKISGMLHSFNADKCKTSLRLATSRMKLLKNKKEAQVKAMRRDVAGLLQSGQEQTARIRVEHIIREEKMISAFEWIELYCEIIVARLPIIESQKACPIDLKEAIATVIFAAPRCADVPELVDIRKHFAAKYGKDFVNAALEIRPDCGVNRTVVEKMSANLPDVQTKMKSLVAIAQEHNIDWSAEAFEKESTKEANFFMLGDNSTAYSTSSPYMMNPPVMHEASRHPLNSSDSGLNISLGEQNNSKLPDAKLNSEEAYDQREWNSSQSTTNQNMEFKDAASAARSAAESAEMASKAAKAAAELASRGSFSGKHHSVSYEGSGQDRKYIVMEPLEHVSDEHKSRSPHRNSSNLHSQPEVRKSGKAGSDVSQSHTSSTSTRLQVPLSGPRADVGTVEAYSGGISPSMLHSPPAVDHEFDETDMNHAHLNRKQSAGEGEVERHSGSTVGSFKRDDADLDYKFSPKSLHEPISYDWSTTMDDRSETGAQRPPGAVFDQSDTEADDYSIWEKHDTGNLLGSPSSRHADEHVDWDRHDDFASRTDWGLRSGTGAPEKESTSSIFFSAEGEPAGDAKLSTRKPSVHSHDYNPPAFDSYDDNEDTIDIGEPVDEGRHVSALASGDTLKSTSRKGTVHEDDIIYEPESSSFQKFPQRGQFREKQEKLSGVSFSLSREEEPRKLPTSSEYGETRESESQLSPSAVQISALSFNNDEDSNSLKFERLTGGLKNRGYQRPPFVKASKADNSPKQIIDDIPSGAKLSSVQDTDEDAEEIRKDSVFSPRGEKNTGRASWQSRPRPANSYLKSDDEEVQRLSDANVDRRGDWQSKQRVSASSIGSQFDLYGEDEPQPRPPVARMSRRTYGVASEARKTTIVVHRPELDTDELHEPAWKPEHRAGAASIEAKRSPQRDTVRDEAPRDTVRDEAPAVPKLPAQPNPVKLPSAAALPASSSVESTDSPSSARGEGKKPAHVHPKLPDYDSFMAFFNRGDS